MNIGTHRIKETSTIWSLYSGIMGTVQCETWSDAVSWGRKGTCPLIDISIPSDNVLKETSEQNTETVLPTLFQRVWNVKVRLMPVRATAALLRQCQNHLDDIQDERFQRRLSYDGHFVNDDHLVEVTDIASFQIHFSWRRCVRITRYKPWSSLMDDRIPCNKL
jgi:hypothetical protein